MRKIIHIDADCFFAAVETRDNPRLKGLPIAVGGAPGRRGVVCTASYEARKFGVHSAMASAHALRLCPSLQIIPPDMARYKEASLALHDIFHRYTDAIEPLSLDEAFLDVGQSTDYHGSASWMAQAIQREVKRELGLSVSAGVAPVKFLAKVASDWNKPAGFFAVTPRQVPEFVAKLPVSKLPGVGPVSQTKLSGLGIYHCCDVVGYGLQPMVKRFGAFGAQLYERAQGVDARTVSASHTRKSLSVERTYESDITPGSLNQVAGVLADNLAGRFEGVKALYEPSKSFVKLKFSDFSQTVIESRLPTSSGWPPLSYFQRLLHAAWQRQKLPMRLVGVGIRLNPLGEFNGRFQQMELF